MRLCLGVDAVTLEQGVGVGHIGHAMQQERNQRRAFAGRHASKHRCELARVLAPVVGRHLHARDQHLGLGRFACARHGDEVVARHLQRQAAQCVVAAELDDHKLRLMLGQQGGQSRAPTRRGVAADAGVDDGPRQFVGGHALVDQGHPARAALQAVFRRQTITHHQQALARCARVRGGEERVGREQRGTVLQASAPTHPPPSHFVHARTHHRSARHQQASC